jgi:hypothetical protein
VELPSRRAILSKHRYAEEITPSFDDRGADKVLCSIVEESMKAR